MTYADCNNAKDKLVYRMIEYQEEYGEHPSLIVMKPVFWQDLSRHFDILGPAVPPEKLLGADLLITERPEEPLSLGETIHNTIGDVSFVISDEEHPYKESVTDE